MAARAATGGEGIRVAMLYAGPRGESGVLRIHGLDALADLDQSQSPA